MSLVVGMDVGGTHVKLVAMAPADGVRLTRSVPTGSGEDVDRLIAELAAAVAEVAELAGSEATAIGVGCAGLIDVERGIVGLSPNLPSWRDVPLRDLLAEAAGLPVTLINDADAFAFGEAALGAGHGARCGLYVTLGTGVGGAIVAGGRLFGGAFGTAGEIGHMCVDVDGPRCPCGGRGCLEMFVGNARIVERARRLVESGAESILGSEIDALTPKRIAEAAAGGDWAARRAFDETGRILGIALAGVCNLLSVDRVVIGGGVARAGDVLLGPVAEAVHAHTMAPTDQKPRVVPSAFGAEAGAIGAAMYANEFAVR